MSSHPLVEFDYTTAYLFPEPVQGDEANTESLYEFSTLSQVVIMMDSHLM